MNKLDIALIALITTTCAYGLYVFVAYWKTLDEAQGKARLLRPRALPARSLYVTVLLIVASVALGQPFFKLDRYFSDLGILLTGLLAIVLLAISAGYDCRARLIDSMRQNQATDDRDQSEISGE